MIPDDEVMVEISFDVGAAMCCVTDEIFELMVKVHPGLREMRDGFFRSNNCSHNHHFREFFQMAIVNDVIKYTEDHDAAMSKIEEILNDFVPLSEPVQPDTFAAILNRHERALRKMEEPSISAMSDGMRKMLESAGFTLGTSATNQRGHASNNPF